ncbi:MAG: response regulator [Bacteroidales bacterium]|nr:response regulator [Bacteroidales bacterium]
MYTSITHNARSVKEKMIENYYILNQIVQSIDTGILIIFDRKLIFVNNETRRIAQRTYKDIESHLIKSVSPKHKIQVLRAFLSVQNNYSDRQELFMDIFLPNGERKALRCRFSKIKIKESEAVFVTLHDVVDPDYTPTFSRPISILWRRYVSEYTNVFSKPYDFLMMVDEFYILTNISRKFETVTGYRRVDYIGRRFDTMPGIEPYVELVQAFQNCKAGYGTGRVARTLHMKMTSRNGNTLKFSITLTPIFYRGARQKVCAAFHLIGQEFVTSSTAGDNTLTSAYQIPDMTGKTILIAEDAEINFILLRKLLEKTKATIIWAKNGVECVNYFKAQPDISLILMDMQMPIMDGYKAVAKILEIDNTVPIIAQTAFGFMEERAKILSIGCADTLFKPIDKKILFEKVAALAR